MRRLALLACALALAGCGVRRPAPTLHYYTLHLPDAAVARLDAPVVIDRVTADPPYRTPRIAYRPSPYRIEYYVYHRWAADPSELLAMAMRDHLAQPSVAGGVPPVRLDVHVQRLEEVDAPEGWRGALVLDVTARRGDTVLLQRTFDETEPAARRHPEAVAAAISRALGRVLDSVVRTIAAETTGAQPRATAGRARTGASGVRSATARASGSH